MRKHRHSMMYEIFFIISLFLLRIYKKLFLRDKAIIVFILTLFSARF